MTPLRKKTIDLMILRGYGESTQKNYLRRIARFARHFGKCTRVITSEEVRGYFVMLGKNYKPATVTNCYSPLRFLYEGVLGRDEVFKEIPRPKRAKHEDIVILSQEEIALYLGAIQTAQERALILLMYAAGLRINENPHA